MNNPIDMDKLMQNALGTEAYQNYQAMTPEERLASAIATAKKPLPESYKPFTKKQFTPQITQIDPEYMNLAIIFLRNTEEKGNEDLARAIAIAIEAGVVSNKELETGDLDAIVYKAQRYIGSFDF